MTGKKRILICSDPLMTSDREQASNNRWLFDLMKRPLSRATGLTPSLFAAGGGEKGEFSRSEFFKKCGIEFDSEQAQFWFDHSKVNDEAIAYLATFVGPCDLVVGYELSEGTRTILNRMGIHYVDIWLHQIRFMDDMLFAFNSNNPDIRDRIFNYDMPDDQMHLYADRIRVQTYKGWRRVEADIAENSALFIGQMLNDKSVCDNGKMLNILDFKDRVEAAAVKYSKIYYARHPYLRSGDEEIMRFIKAHPSIELTTIPAYRMLSSPNLAHVFGISSSVIQEAKYFGKSTEYLFRPVLTSGDRSNTKSYATIFQDFISPHFWSDILRLSMRTFECPEIRFQDPKDKIRDMLGFYWSYSDIDKNEHIRQRVNNSLRAKPTKADKPASSKPAPQKAWPAPAGFYQSRAQLDAFDRLIDQHKVISFDIFDTLIERIVDKPGDIHPMMALKAAQITDGKIQDFTKARREARDQALDRANGEEVLLKDRFQAMAEHYGLTPEQGEALHQLELELELEVCKPRFVGLRALERAVKTRKRVILVSDIFFERDFILALLESCGIKGWDRIYLSSEEGVLKHTGRLFDVVLKEEKVRPEKILHIGDNAKADIEMGADRGLSTYHITEKRLIAERASPAIKAMQDITDDATRSLIKGLVSREFTSTALPDLPGSSKGSPEFLGYGIAGPMFWGFAKWVADQAADKGLTDLCFLARDGDIAKQCYDIIVKDMPRAPKSHYLLASRRAVNVARINASEDILKNLQTNFTPCSFETLLMNRFGVNAEDIDVSTFQACGYANCLDMANWNRDKDRIAQFFSSQDVSALILRNAAKERELLVENYRGHGLGEPGCRVGFIDIGHSGTLQAAITDIMGIEESTGFYFATKSDIDGNLGTGHQSHGYAVDRIDHKDANHPYQKHILLFELLFQNQDGSFLCYKEGKNGVEPQFIDLPSEAPRIEFIKSVHRGVVRFAADMEEICQAAGIEPSLPGKEAILAYSEMLKNPWPADAQIYKPIGFENKYSARDIRWIIAPEGDDKTPSIWAEGAKALHQPAPIIHEASGFIPVGLISFFVTNDRLKRKLHRDPDAFFADSRKPLVRMIGKYVC